MNSKVRSLGITLAVAMAVMLVLLSAIRPARASGVVSGSCTETDLNNALTGGGLVTFSCGGPKTINFTSYKQISDDTTIDGGGAITFDGQNLTELFQVLTGKTLTLKNITLANANGSGTGVGALENFGALIIINSQVNNSYSPNNGGAIYNSGALTITTSTFKNNRANRGGAIYNDGGAVSVAGSTFIHNVVTTTGGAINNSSGSFVLQTSTLTNSHANDGGAVFVNTGSDILINASNLLSNSAGYGGAIENNGGIITLTASTIDRNRSDNDGGGVWSISGQVTFNGTNVTNNRAGATGGGISNYGDVMSMTNMIVSGNAVNDQGGGIYNAAVMTLTNVTISNNLTLNTAAESDGGGVYNSSLLNMTGGSVINNRSISPTGAALAGGGFYNNSTGNLELTNVLIEGNRASVGGGIENVLGTLSARSTTIYSNTGYSGAGGLNNSGSGAAASIIDSQLNNNYGGGPGGGILQSTGATLIISQTRISQNLSTFRGGGLRNFGSVNIYQSTFDNNTAPDGGGIANRGSIYLENSTLSANTATDSGGVIGGGGILSERNVATVDLLNVTFNQNQALIGAGLQITDVGVLYMRNTAIADTCDVGSVFDNGGNHAVDTNCLITTNADLKLGPLTNTGGSTPTHLPMPGSPLIDGGTNTGCPAIDQRGKARPYNGTCDSGSVEFSAGDPTSWVYLPLVLK